MSVRNGLPMSKGRRRSTVLLLFIMLNGTIWTPLCLLVMVNNVSCCLQCIDVGRTVVMFLCMMLGCLIDHFQAKRYARLAYKREGMRKTLRNCVHMDNAQNMLFTNDRFEFQLHNEDFIDHSESRYS